VRLAARAFPSHLSRRLVQPGHHSVVWKGGRARFGALFVSDVSDHDVRAALQSLGARAGENLTAESWTKRKDANNPEPDKRVEGSPVEVFVEWNGSGGPRPLSSLLMENNAPVRFDWSEIHTEALSRSAELRRQKWVIKQDELRLQASKNFLLPRLDMVALYRWRGFGDHLAGSASPPPPWRRNWVASTGASSPRSRGYCDSAGAYPCVTSTRCACDSAIAVSSSGQSAWSDSTKPRSIARRRRCPRTRIHPDANPLTGCRNRRAHGVLNADGGARISAFEKSAPRFVVTTGVDSASLTPAARYACE
jgi:hypothetical protein